ncbi:hypothetical protein Gekk315_00021 [Aeromonas phage Gekk3-15]
MASTILVTSASKSGVKISNLTTNTTVFLRMAAMDAEVTMEATNHKSKMESGNIIVDGKTIQPFKVYISGFAQSFEELEAATKVLASKSHYYSVTINGIAWDNVLADELNIDQSAEALSVSPITLAFTQAIVRQFDYVKTDAPADSPNRKFGDVKPNGATMTLGNLLDSILKRI